MNFRLPAGSDLRLEAGRGGRSGTSLSRHRDRWGSSTRSCKLAEITSSPCVRSRAFGYPGGGLPWRAPLPRARAIIPRSALASRYAALTTAAGSPQETEPGRIGSIFKQEHASSSGRAQGWTNPTLYTGAYGIGSLSDIDSERVFLSDYAPQKSSSGRRPGPEAEPSHTRGNTYYRFK